MKVKVLNSKSTALCQLKMFIEYESEEQEALKC